MNNPKNDTSRTMADAASLHGRPANDVSEHLAPSASMMLGCIACPVGTVGPGADDLEKLKADRQRLVELRSYMEWLEWRIRARERDLIGLIESGVLIDGATVVTRRRQSISWLTVVERELGRDVVRQVKDTWPITFTKELQVA
jgi:hypothetical protein